MNMNLESSTETTELDQTAEISSSASVESFDEIPETEENFDDCGLEDSQEYTETPEKESKNACSALGTNQEPQYAVY